MKKELIDKESLINDIYKLPIDLETMSIVREWIRDFTPYAKLEIFNEFAFNEIYNKLP